MRLVVMGTGPFAVPMFKALLPAGHSVAALLTRPVHGTGTPPPNPLRIVAESLGIPVLVPESINGPEALQALRSLLPQLLVVCDYGQILKPEALALAPLGGINLHGSLLPKYRGAAPIQRALLAGETTTGITVIHMTPRLDGGPILASRSVDVGAEETAIELESRLAELGVDAVLETISILHDWDGMVPLGKLQDPHLVSKAPRLQKSEGAVDWSHSAAFIDRQVRALKPWPTTYTFWHRPGQAPLRLILDQARTAPASQGIPGQIVGVDADQLLVATGDGDLSILRVQPAGKRPMSIGEFLRGHAMSIRQTLGSA